MRTPSLRRAYRNGRLGPERQEMRRRRSSARARTTCRRSRRTRPDNAATIMQRIVTQRPETDAATIGRRIAARLREAASDLRNQWISAAPVRHFVIDDLLPSAEAEELFRNLPPTSSLMRKKSLRERKWVGVAVDQYHPAVGAHRLACQAPEVLAVIAEL